MKVKWNDVRPGVLVWYEGQVNLVQRVQFTSMDKPGEEQFVTLSNEHMDVAVKPWDDVEVVTQPPTVAHQWMGDRWTVHIQTPDDDDLPYVVVNGATWHA